MKKARKKVRKCGDESEKADRATENVGLFIAFQPIQRQSSRFVTKGLWDKRAIEVTGFVRSECSGGAYEQSADEQA